MYDSYECDVVEFGRSKQRNCQMEKTTWLCETIADAILSPKAAKSNLWFAAKLCFSPNYAKLCKALFDKYGGHFWHKL